MGSKKKTIYMNTKKKKGYSKSEGSYVTLKKGERVFTLVSLKTGKGRAYESVKAALNDGWFKV